MIKCPQITFGGILLFTHNFFESYVLDTHWIQKTPQTIENIRLFRLKNLSKT